MNCQIDALKKYTSVPDPKHFPMHAHDGYEIFCFLSGDAKYFVEGNIYKLRKNDILVIKKAESHSLLIHTPIPYERIAIHFSPEDIYPENKNIISFLNSRPLGKNNRYAAEKCGNNNWIYYLEKICFSKDETTKKLYLNVILSELYENADKATEGSLSHDSTTDIIKYINENLATIKNLDEICRQFFISKTQLNRNFKRMTGSTVWEYIITKRLLLAKEYLRTGITATISCEKSGFSDYCSFFKLYKKKFGISPKNDHIKKDQTE